ncbi:MAG: SMP-30/gluconolactonase/LRE family protein [Xylophilus ampelinus]
MITIERLGGLTTALGECPVWHGQRLWLMDCRRGLILGLDPGTGAVLARHEAPAPTGSFAFDAGGGIVVALREEIALLDPATGRLRTLARIDASHPHLRLNDGTALPDGSFVAGTMHTFRAPGEAPLGGLYRLAPDLGLRRIADGIGTANGPCVDPATGRFHLADTVERTIHSYAMAADGALSDRRLFVRTDALGSGPDGCCFDDAGGLWTALVRAGAIARFDPQGRLTHRIGLPLAHPAALCFGGDGGATLFVTSISDSGRLKADGPLDGAVLRIAGTGFRGPPRPLCRLAV